MPPATPRPTAWAFVGAVVAVALGWAAASGQSPPVTGKPHVAPFATVGPNPIAGALAAVPDALSDVIYLLPNDAAIKPRMGWDDDLPRQLARQAVWVAAREDFGLRVLDADLGDPLPAKLPPDRQVRIRGPVFPPPLGGVFCWELTVGPLAAETRVWASADMAPVNRFIMDPAKSLATAGGLSRGALSKGLAAARFAPKPRQASDAPVPADAAARLGEMRMTSQFAAVRLLHAEVAAKGESPALAAALARGYAGLGLLTDHHWGLTAPAYKARALVYSERLSLKHPRSIDAEWARAYVAALVGRHDVALAALAAAKTLAAADPAAPAAPPWVETIDAYVRFDAKRLAAPRAKADAPLAKLLQFLAAEDLGAGAATLRAARVALAAEPEGYIVRNTVYRVGGLSNLQSATQAAPKAFADTLLERVEAQPGLPASVAAALAAEAPTEAGLYAALRAAGDPAADRGEPSVAALGGMLRDQRFVMTWQRMYFMTYNWGVDAAPALAEASDALAGHPLLPLLEALATDRRRDPSAHRKALAAAPTAGLDLRAVELYHVSQEADPDGAGRWYQSATHINHGLYRDVLRYFQVVGVGNDNERERHEELARVSPLSSMTAAAQADLATPEAVGKLAGLEEAYPDSAAVQRAVGARHLADKRYDDAARCYRRWVELSPDAPASQGLARVYRAAGDDARWLATMEASLKLEDNGLEHAAVRFRLAEHFMLKKDFARAAPYALAAAETGAGWAMIQAAECQVELKEFDSANALYRRAAGRYDGEAFAWYFACRASGKMDKAGATAAVEAYVTDLPEAAPEGHPYQAARFYQMTGRPREALVALKRFHLDPGHESVNGGLFAALVADGVKDAPARAAAVALALRPHKRPSGDPKVAKLFGGWLEAAGAPDAAAVEAGLKGLTPADRADAELYAGWLLLNRGAGDRAVEQWRRCLKAEGGTNSIKTHAKAFLEDRLGADD